MVDLKANLILLKENLSTTAKGPLVIRGSIPFIAQWHFPWSIQSQELVAGIWEQEDA